MRITVKKINSPERYRKRFDVDAQTIDVFFPTSGPVSISEKGIGLSLEFGKGPHSGNSDHMTLELETKEEAKALAFKLLEACGWRLDAMDKSSEREYKNRDIIQSGAQ